MMMKKTSYCIQSIIYCSFNCKGASNIILISIHLNHENIIIIMNTSNKNGDIDDIWQKTQLSNKRTTCTAVNGVKLTPSVNICE